MQHQIQLRRRVKCFGQWKRDVPIVRHADAQCERPAVRFGRQTDHTTKRLGDGPTEQKTAGGEREPDRRRHPRVAQRIEVFVLGDDADEERRQQDVGGQPCQGHVGLGGQPPRPSRHRPGRHHQKNAGDRRKDRKQSGESVGGGQTEH